MGKLRDWWVVALVLVLLGAGVYLWVTPPGEALFGDRLPAVQVQTLDGGSLNLASLRGKVLLVNFWATTCPGCIAEIPELVALQKAYGPQGFAVVGIAMRYDDPRQVRALAAADHLPYVVALDSDGKAAEQFGHVNLTPTSFLVAPDGRIIERKVGNFDFRAMERRIRDLLPDVRPALSS